MAHAFRVITLEVPTVGLIPKKTVARMCSISDRTLCDWAKPKDGQPPLFPVKPVISGHGRPSMYDAEQIHDWLKALRDSPVGETETSRSLLHDARQ